MVQEVYRAQKLRDTAVQERVAQAQKERDDALHQLERARERLHRMEQQHRTG